MASHFADNSDDRVDVNLTPGTQATTPVIPRIDDADDDLPQAVTSDVQLGGAAQCLISSHDRENLTRVRRKRRSGKRAVLIGLGIVALSIALVSGLFAYWVSTLDRTMRMDPEENRALVESLTAPNGGVPANEMDPFYVLIVGSDARETVAGARGDVMILARVDAKNGVVHLVSIPRDTIVIADGGREMKINASFAYGGASGAVKYVSEFAGVPISHYVEIDFEGLVSVIDALGGVWVDVPEAFSARGYSFDAGPQLLDGEQALVYARERYSFSGGDFTRAQSQRQIVKGVIDKVLQASPADIPGIVQELAGMVTTDYHVTELVKLALAFRESGVTLYSSVCPSYAFWKDDVSYVGTMHAEWQDMMRRVDAGLDPNDTTQTIPEPQASSTTLGAATNSGSPEDYQELADSSALTTDDVNTPAG